MKTKIPVDFIFNPNWWYRNYEIPFAEDFYLNKQVRVNNDVSMRRALFERFGFGEPNPQPRPILGSMQVAGGFVVPALLGREIRFSPAEAPVAVTGRSPRGPRIGEAPFLGGCAHNRSCRDLHSLDNGDMFNRDEPFDQHGLRDP